MLDHAAQHANNHHLTPERSHFVVLRTPSIIVLTHTHDAVILTQGNPCVKTQNPYLATVVVRDCLGGISDCQLVS